MYYFKYLMFLAFCDLSAQVAPENGGPAPKKNHSQPILTQQQPAQPNEDKSEPIVIDIDKAEHASLDSNVVGKEPQKVLNNSHQLPENMPKTVNDSVEIDKGAITRGFLVVMGIGLLFIIYVGIKTWGRKKHDKSNVIVRKYGVQTNRSDHEMELLPLSDDEEDDTVFDLAASRNSLH